MPIDVHPLVVHFPIALVLTAFLLDWGRWLLDRDRLYEAGFWNGSTPLLLLAFITAVVAVISGLVSEKSIEQSAALHELVESHELFAFISAGGLALLAFWRIALRGAFPVGKAWLYLLLLLVVAAAVAVGGYFGGLMVHVHGAGIAM